MFKKFLFPFIILFLLIISCAKIVIVDKDTIYKANKANKVNEMIDSCNISTFITNHAENIVLNIYSCKIEGYDKELTNDIYGEYNDTIRLNDITVNVNDTKKMKYIINGELIMDDILLYSGNIYIPISIGQIYTNNEIPLELYPDCPWYVEENGKYRKLLQPISFSIEIEDWNVIEYEIVI